MLLPLLAACDRAERSPGPQAGMALPAVELPLLNGGSYRFTEKSTPCLINFWATWCPPCRAEMAALNRLSADYAARGLAVIAVSVDEDANLVREFVRQEALSLPVLLDRGSKLATSAFGVRALPTSLLVNGQGRVSAVWLGERDWDAADVRAAIVQSLGG